MNLHQLVIRGGVTLELGTIGKRARLALVWGLLHVLRKKRGLVVELEIAASVFSSLDRHQHIRIIDPVVIVRILHLAGSEH